jgi:hypothetical protein
MAMSKGDRVRWNWGFGDAEGTVQSVHTSRVEKTIKGSQIVRNADEDNPAYTIEQDDGDVVLKSHSEVEPA